jgi:histidinol-phosphate aminotransferase
LATTNKEVLSLPEGATYEVVKLASNENPLPVSHRVRMAIEQAITEVGRYPDGNGFELKQSIAI